MPYDGLKRFRMGCDMCGVHDRDNDTGISNLSSIAFNPSDDTAYVCPNLFRVLEGCHEVGAHLALDISTADREDQQHVFGTQTTDAEPCFRYRNPALIIGSCCQFGNVIRWSVGFHTSQFAEVVHGVGS